jgi:hypothetical protein
MKNMGAIPKASTLSFRYGISTGATKAGINMKRSDISKERIAHILKKDAEEFVGSGYADAADLITNGRFAKYNGNINHFLAGISQRKKLDLLLVIAIGKIDNNLKCEFKRPDLVNLIFFSRLNAFAGQLEKLTGKKVSVAIAIENTFFDKHVLRVPDPMYTRTTTVSSKRMVSDFGLKHLHLYPIDRFLSGKKYLRDFYSSVSSLDKKKASIRGLSEFKTFYRVFYESYPTTTFEEAVRLYTTPTSKKAIAEWAADSTIRYISFFRARDEMDFWGTNGEYVRTSVSPRKGVLQFEYGVGRMSPLHGMATYNNGKISTERFYDVVMALHKKGRMPVWYYNGAPFCADISGIKFDA